MNEKPLSAKQQRFVDEYLIDLNATQAYIRAGYKATPASANTAAPRLLADVRVQAQVKAAMEKRNERLQITQDYVLTKIQDVVEKCSQAGLAYDPGAVLRGAELLGRHMKMFTDKFEHSGAVSVTIARFGPEKAAS